MARTDSSAPNDNAAPPVEKASIGSAGQESAASPAVDSFISRWSKSGASERANYQLFLSELCTILGVPLPDPSTPDDHENALRGKFRSANFKCRIAANRTSVSRWETAA